jgi:3-dehydroquinate dehydratase II
MKRITIINGANLNLLGVREPGIYGNKDFNTFLEELKKAYPNVQLDYFQSNVEGEIINLLQENGFNSDGIILNAGGYTHTSIAIADAVAAIKSPVVEVHISNILAREEERKTSLISKHCKGLISGLGLEGYELALIWFLKK